MSAAAATSEFVYADFEHSCTTQKQTNLLFAQSQVPLQRLLSARRIASPNEFDDPIAVATLLCRDSEWTVRDAVASQLGALCRAQKWKDEDQSKMLSILINLCHDHQSVQVRISAANSLAMIHHPLRLQSWLQLTRDKDSRVRFSGATCLGRVLLSASLDQQSMSMVVCELYLLAVEDESFTVRRCALKSLCGTMGKGPSAMHAVKALVHASTDFAWPVRVACCEALPLVVSGCSSGGGSDLADKLASLLLPLVEMDTNAFVRQAGRRSLGWFLAQNPHASSEQMLKAYCKLAVSQEEEQRFLFAFYLPGVVMRNAKQWDPLLQVSFVELSNDISGRIRRTLAHSIHQLAKEIGLERAERDLLPVFTSFLADMDDEEEIKLGAVRSASKFLLHLPPTLRSMAFRRVVECLEELDSPASVSLALSRDARLALATTLGEFAKLELQDQFSHFFLMLAQDQAQVVREKAVECVGLVNLQEYAMLCVLEWASHSHYSWRYLFCCAARSAKLHNTKLFTERFLPIIHSAKLPSDAVIAVRTEAEQLLLV